MKSREKNRCRNQRGKFSILVKTPNTFRVNNLRLQIFFKLLLSMFLAPVINYISDYKYRNYTAEISEKTFRKAAVILRSRTDRREAGVMKGADTERKRNSKFRLMKPADRKRIIWAAVRIFVNCVIPLSTERTVRPSEKRLMKKHTLSCIFEANVINTFDAGGKILVRDNTVGKVKYFKWDQYGRPLAGESYTTLNGIDSFIGQSLLTYDDVNYIYGTPDIPLEKCDSNMNLTEIYVKHPALGTVSQKYTIENLRKYIVQFYEWMKKKIHESVFTKSEKIRHL